MSLGHLWSTLSVPFITPSICVLDSLYFVVTKTEMNTNMRKLLNDVFIQIKRIIQTNYTTKEIIHTHHAHLLLTIDLTTLLFSRRK